MKDYVNNNKHPISYVLTIRELTTQNNQNNREVCAQDIFFQAINKTRKVDEIKEESRSIFQILPNENTPDKDPTEKIKKSLTEDLLTNKVDETKEEKKIISELSSNGKKTRKYKRARPSENIYRWTKEEDNLIGDHIKKKTKYKEFAKIYKDQSTENQKINERSTEAVRHHFQQRKKEITEKSKNYKNIFANFTNFKKL